MISFKLRHVVFYVLCSVFCVFANVQYAQSTDTTVQSGYVSTEHDQVAQVLHVYTQYGSFDVTEPVLIELFEHEVMQRLKHIQQYGVFRFSTPELEDFTRYDHSVGVWALLRRFGAELDQQIAGLLHDASHTVFSHSIEPFFKRKDAESSYQDTIHAWYLAQQGVNEVLERHGYCIEQIMPDDHIMLEQPLPGLCADRLEYNLRAGLDSGMITLGDMPAMLAALRYEDGQWFFTDAAMARKLADVSLYYTQHVWGGPVNYLNNEWLSQAIARAVEIELINFDDIHFSHDDTVWQMLQQSDDEVIAGILHKITTCRDSFELCEPCDAHMTGCSKFRGLNPLIRTIDEHGQEVFVRLVDVDQAYAEAFDTAKNNLKQGWGIRLLDLTLDNNVC
ncbi:MAG: HD domain-containing protein [Epsilonproteobacteria bacterium]|nr:HD domain-containing protein [Campylobacterota bacterium]